MTFAQQQGQDSRSLLLFVYTNYFLFTNYIISILRSLLQQMHLNAFWQYMRLLSIVMFAVRTHRENGKRPTK